MEQRKGQELPSLPSSPRNSVDSDLVLPEYSPRNDVINSPVSEITNNSRFSVPSRWVEEADDWVNSLPSRQTELDNNEQFIKPKKNKWLKKFLRVLINKFK